MSNKQQAKFQKLNLKSMQGFKSTLTHSQALKQKSKLKPQLQSINQLYQEQSGSECNYCHKGLSYSWGLVSKNYEPYTYQTMMQRGWRRCGTYYYKLDLQKSCCKQWTHRLDVGEFKIKRDQKKTFKRMMAWVYEPVMEMKEEAKEKVTGQKGSGQHGKGSNGNKKGQNGVKKQNGHKSQAKSQQKIKPQAKSTKLITELSPSTLQFIKNICTSLNQHIKTKLSELIPQQKLQPQSIQKEWNWTFLEKIKSFPSKAQQKSDYYCNWGMLLYGSNKQKWKKEFGVVDFIKTIKQEVEGLKLSEDYQVRLERGGYLLIELGDRLKEDKEFQIIKEVKEEQKPKIEEEKQVKQVNPTTSVYEKMELQNQPQIKRHASSNQFQKLQPTFIGQLKITPDKITFGRITINLVQAQENHQSWHMYQRYCTQIHQKQEKGFSSYTNFLCERALTFGKEIKTIDEEDNLYYQPAFDPTEQHQKKQKVTGNIVKRQGCYHMKYYLDNKLIGVGVIDLLPNGLSSVYFFYEPEYKDHRLGVFSSLIEIEYVRYLSLSFPQFKYYYLGFYIHDNEKMAYKGDYGPFQLLCPISYNFVTVDQIVMQKINKIVRQGHKNVRLAPQTMEKDPDMTFTSDLGVYIDRNIRLTYRNKPLKLKDINKQFYLPVLMILKAYLAVWGKEIFDILTFTF